MAEHSGFIDVMGFKLFYRSFGSGDNALLCLHGGPGVPHYYLLPLAKLASDHFRVVLYDQLGVGNSEKPDDLSLFNIERGADEVEGVRKALNLGKMNLLGSSYGGALALQYALKYQENIRKMVIASGLSSVALTVSEMIRLKTQLPKQTQEVMKKYEEKFAFLHPEYLKAVDEYYHNFLCRLSEWPDDVKRALNELSVPVYFTQNGPNEFTIIGTWKGWDITDRLPEIKVPTLVTVGRYDEVTPKVAEIIHKGIRGSTLRVFEKSAHLTMWDEEELYLQVVREFLA
ncbi:MAG TPA: proline iminopeptidase-family hydrolase [Candidatus Acidoferrales bacterium]|nr:proline iminopeptidase-family hydrolase [Candidatus Acidoferrales bacterium]